ncbi:MAG: phosphotransferase [Victivallales bacterium]|nr:phosphotransferase [Victivallales bacterium]
MAATPFKSGGWSGIAAEEFAKYLPSLESILADGTIIVNKPDRIVRRLDLDGASFFAKSFLKPKRLDDRLKRAIRKPIPFKLWRIHDEMLAKGVGCPRPMVAATDNGGTQLFICTAISFPRSCDLIRRVSLEGLPGVFTKAAHAIAKLHRAGFIHGDALPGNICLDDDGSAAFIDNDRTSHIPPLFGGVARRRNLVQFCAHTFFREEIDIEHYTLFFVEYMKEYVNVTPSTETVDGFIRDVRTRTAEIQAERAAR